jgi:outer membrane protein insertion porin family
MMKCNCTPSHKTFTVVLLLALSACSTTRTVPEGDALYTGATVKVEKTDVPAKQKKAITASLQGLTRPKPNTKILGLPIKLWMYNLGSSKGLGKWLRNKLGEPPVLMSQVNVERNVEVLDNYLENRGFFHVKVSGDTTIKGKKGSAKYGVETGPEYKINEIHFPEDSSALGSAVRATRPKTLLKAGAPFNLDLIKGERTRIDVELKEKGFYFFSPDYLVIQVDSTIGNYQVNMYMTVKPNTPDVAREVYSIKDVFIYSNYSLNNAKSDTSLRNGIFHKGYYVIDSAKTFNPRVFEQAMQFEPGDIYSRKDHNESLARLIDLGTFKFVKNRFETVNDTGVNKLNAYYYLTPQPRKSLRAEITGTSKSNNLTGSQITLGWRNRNAFKGAEQLYINVFGGSEVQISGNFGRSNTFRVGGEATLSIPRFVVPIVNIDRPGQFVPRTNILVGYELVNRTNLYTLTSIRGNYGYMWKESIQKEHQFNPIAINYVQPLNVTQVYKDSMAQNPTLAKIIEQQFIIGSTYNYNYNQLAGSTDRTGIYFNGLADLSGNIYGLVSGADVKNGKGVEILGSRFSQYIKTEIDARYYRQIGLKSQWANRIILGYGYPYGNSVQLPFIKQFFAGGNNSLRGFRSRSVGPGSYRPAGSEDPKRIFLPDQSGDIKLEFNTEYRPKLISIVEGAVFFDAGNVWLVNEDPFKPGARFTKDFLKQLAMDAGVGIRLDLTILLLRVDFAFPLKYAYDNPPEKKGVVINLAIGYPF